MASLRLPRPGAILVVAALAVAGLFADGVPCARAHEGPEHEIEELTVLIEGRGESAGLLVERAIEYAVLHRIPEALRDLERAVQLDPGSLHALRELARLQFLGGKLDEAYATLTRGLRLDTADPVDRGGLLVLRAEVQRAQGRMRKALDDCEAAIRLHPLNPEWYLIRSDLQRTLRLNRRRLAGIEEGVARTGAGILEFERVEALLDAGRFREALERIEPELESSRVRCRWLVRRGRARIGLRMKAEGEEDLRVALVEIGGLLDPSRPDATLLLDQATALALLGDREALRRCHELARDRGGDPAITERIGALVKD